MANQLEMVNGVLQPMSDADQAQYDALQTAWIIAQPNIAIRKQIDALEALQTPRRVREGGQWMIDLNNQITALREQLK